MHISRELFAEITGLRVAQAEPAEVERRHSNRLSMPESIVVIPTQGHTVGDPSFAKLRDISVAGIGFLSCCRVNKGSTCLVRLPRKNKRDVWIHCDVVGCTAAGDGLFHVGATFRNMMRPTENLPEPAANSMT